jgi:hypothetical protein
MTRRTKEGYPRIRSVGLPAALLSAALCAWTAAAAAPARPAAAAPRGGAEPGAERGIMRPAERYNAEVAVRWARLLYDRIRAERLSPPVASRAIGYAGVALYEAVVRGMNDHRSLAGQLNGLDAPPSFERRFPYHWPSVANAAQAAVMRALFASASTETRAAIDALETDLAGGFRDAAPRPILARSIRQGRLVGEHIAAWASGDGYDRFNNCPYTPPEGEGLWTPTPPAFAPPLQPCWGRLRPFALPSADACLPPSHPAYSEAPGTAFYAEGLEVHDTVRDLTTGQREIALFWADNPGQTGTPPGHSLLIAVHVVEQDALSLGVAAEAIARTGIAVADGFISCWQAKFIYNLLRPVTYVQEVIDPGWLPPLPTPPFPEYTSGHSVQSVASAHLLTDLFGARAFTDYTHVGIGLAPRTFASFQEAALEAAISRLYGGIHFRSGIDVGVAQGGCVGRRILEAVRFRADVDGR